LLIIAIRSWLAHASLNDLSRFAAPCGPSAVPAVLLRAGEHVKKGPAFQIRVLCGFENGYS
jgi:hypothetical protein